MSEWPKQMGYEVVEGRLVAMDSQAVIPADLGQAQHNALQGLYDSLPRYSCKSDEPDGCPVCVARATLNRYKEEVGDG